ncbi:MAG TPA: M28 family metallopeptidase [Solirubrobacterales bacterium]|nr:M28 family metallopeptidase [Solirubrobacterales bacterium]
MTVQKKYKTFHPYREGFVIVLLALLTLVGCGDSSSGDQEQVDRFDARAAYALVEEQVGYGQRPAGSPQLRRLAVELRRSMPNGSFEAIPGDPLLRNVVGTLPGREPGIVVGAHYDTLVKPRGFVGANNGAAGSAVVIEAARALRQAPAGGEGRKVSFVLFDGEEPPAGLPEESADFYNEGLRGSRAYVKAHPGETSAMILLDYVGNRGLYLPREASSTEELWSRLLIAAEAVGAQRFFSGEAGPEIIDDHTPFLRSGAPAVDLIDWSYPGHSLADGLDKISRQSLDGVGETVIQLVEELRAE